MYNKLERNELYYCASLPEAEAGLIHHDNLDVFITCTLTLCMKEGHYFT